MAKKKDKEIMNNDLNQGFDLGSAPIEEVQIEVPKAQEDSFAELPPIEKIRMAAAQHGVKIKETSAFCNCKKCNGLGYISTTTNIISSDDGEIKHEIPNPCRCIFEKDDIEKMFTGKILLGHTEARKYHAKLIKEALDKKRKPVLNIIKQQVLKKKKEDRKKKAKLKKKFNKRK